MRIGLIGHLGGDKTFTDGQTVKTMSLLKGLKNKGFRNIICADTFYMRNNPLKFLIQLFFVIFKSDKIVVLLSNRGRKIIFPLLGIVSKKKDIYHYSIGGKLAEEVEKNEKYKKRVSRFKKNWVESHYMADKLNQLGVNNASYLANFKCIEILNKDKLVTNFSEPYKFCMFSRVMKEKGVEDAVNAIKYVNKKLNRTVAVLDIYGPIKHGYEEQFQTLLDKGEGYSRYCGIVSPNDSVNRLKEYYMLLFPTFWEGECMPGTVIDAFSAGVPIIARRWKYCDEMISDKITGYVYNFDEPQKLVDLIIYSIEHYKESIDMRLNCLNKAKEYSEKYVMEQIIKEMKQ